MDIFNLPGDDETTEIGIRKMKRNFSNMISQDESLSFRSVKHNLLPDFDETPTKMTKVPSGPSSSFNRSRSINHLTSKSDDAAIDQLKRELCLKEADITTEKAKVTKWEKQVSKLESEVKQAQIMHDKEIAKIQAVRDREVAKTSELQNKLQYLMGKEKVARDELEEVKKDYDRQKLEMDKKILQIQKKKLEQEDKSQQLRSIWLETEAGLREELMALKSDNILLKSKCEEAEAQLALRKRLQQEKEELDQQVKNITAELKVEKDKNKGLTKSVSDHEDNMVITKALKNDLDLVPSIKSELEKLRLDNEQLRHNELNTHLLEEELRSVKRKLEEALASCEKFTELEVANEELQARLHRWEALDTSGSRRPQSPSSLSRKANDLEISQAMMLLKQGDLESSLKREQMKLEKCQSENGELSLSLSAEKAVVKQQNDFIKRLKKKLLLISKERDSYKNVLDSYESEVTINVDAQHRQQIQRLEEVVKGYQEQSEANDAQMNALEERLHSTQMSYDKVQQQLQVLHSSGGSQPPSQQQETDQTKQLREQVAVLENSLFKVQEEKENLEARLNQRQLQGEYDPFKTKILHVIENPCCQAQRLRTELVDKLTVENDSLRKRNEILESNEGMIEDLTIQVNERLQQPSPTKELEAAKQELMREKTRYKRLIEVYEKTSTEFREICRQLTGYKIDIPCSNQYRLTNVYSTHSNDYLWFQLNEQGELQMLATDFSKSLEELIEKYVFKQQSIPIFLSHVTIDQHSKQTMVLE